MNKSEARDALNQLRLGRQFLCTTAKNKDSVCSFIGRKSQLAPSVIAAATAAAAARAALVEPVVPKLGFAFAARERGGSPRE
mmetsp:Transcript_10284/g.15395  ORF Transcript_10284/g.15395 Transcript_10284/m.15395 type:complete len:82 (-) Transcript_10284:172-417(-)